MLSKHPDISVIICNHVLGELFYKTIASIKDQKNVQFEIIILTSSEELSMVGVPGCLVIHSTKTPAEKRNAGARNAKGNYLAFFDDDVEIDANCLHEFLKALTMNNQIGMVYGKLWNMEHRNRFDEAGGYLTKTGFIWSRAGQNDIDSGQYDEPVPILAGKSASCMVKKSVFNEVGGFDESFGILGEETLIAWRMWLLGYSVYYVPTATGYHAFNCPKLKPVSKHYTNTRIFRNGARNYHSMLIQCLGKEHLWILPIHFLIWCFAGFAMIFTGKVIQGWNVLKGLCLVFVNLKDTLRKRSMIQSNRKVCEKELWPIIHRSPNFSYYRTRICRYVTLGLHG